jgi:peptidoglycan/xylan/chitin deacetylase (PgdA/CDA1 family)
VERVRSGSIDQAYVTLSFDDGYASNRRTAELLGERGISACFFVVTDFIGLTDLQEARAFLGQGIDEAAMTWTDVEQLLSTGHEVGSHTLAHRNLASLSPAQQEEAINDAADMLDRRIGGAAHFAWPLGRWFHMDAHARDTALQRHESCASAERGSHPSGVGPSPNFCPRRDHVMTSWPLRHLQYFTAAGATTGSARGASAGAWPSEW